MTYVSRFAMEGKLLFTQPNDNNWRKGRTIKLTPINALLVTNGKVRKNIFSDVKNTCLKDLVQREVNAIFRLL